MTANAEIADQILELLDNGKNWGKGTARQNYDGTWNPNGPVRCMGNAMLYAIFGTSSEDEIANLAKDLVTLAEFKQAITEIVQDNYPHMYDHEEFTVPRFNDHPDTTWDDIRIVLEKVRAI